MIPGPDLAGRRALVTGSTEGIGRAIARALAAAGAEVIVHGHHPDAAPPDIAPEARFVDFADMAAVDSFIRSLPAVDILVSNVAVQIRQPLAALDDAAIDRQVAINLKAGLRLILALLPHMRAQRWGRILAIGSVQESLPHPDMLIYAGLKAAQGNMMRNLARQVAADGVTVNCLAPGVIRTARNEAVLADAEYAARVLSRIPAGSWGTPDDVAGAAVMLCSDAGRYITGASLEIDGGMHL